MLEEEINASFGNDHRFRFVILDGIKYKLSPWDEEFILEQEKGEL